MKLSIFRFSIVLFALAIFSCKEKEQKTVYDISIRQIAYTDFKFAGELTGVSHELTGVTNPLRLALIPEQNIALVLDGSDNFFWVKMYSLDSFKLISSFLKKGKGNDELVDAFHLQYSQTDKEVYVTGPMSKKMVVYSYTGSASQSRFSFKQSLKVPNTGGTEVSLNAPLVINAAHSIVDLRANKKNTYKMLNFYDSGLHVIKSAADLPIAKSKEPGYIVEQLFYGALALADDRKTIIQDCYATDLITLYDMDGTVRKTVRGPVANEIAYDIQKVGTNSVRVLPAAGAHLGYTAAAVMKDNELFVLYNGKSFNNPDYYASDLFQFSADLTPLKRFKLNHSVYQLSINWKTRTAYGIRNKTKPEIVTFKL